jgi:hypothetical protein
MVSVSPAIARLIFVTGLALGMQACASVKVAVPGLSSASAELETEAHSERVALVEATDRLADQPWGDVAQPGVISVMFGTISENERDAALYTYLAALASRSQDPATSAVADADVSLYHARRVVEAGRQAFVSIRPVPSDIATLEKAIGEARECRAMYVRALRKLEQDDQSIEAIRDAFSQTITDLGMTADLVASRIAANEGRSYFADREGSGTVAAFD